MANIVRDNLKPWSQDADRLLLYADIMGFKNRIYTSSHAEIKKQFIDFRDKLIKGLSQFTKTDNVRVVQFSDSILIVTKGTDARMFNLITKAAARLMHVAIEKGFAIKGVLSKGVFMMDQDRQIYFGKPLVDAALLYDELKFYGIAIHHSAEKIVRSFMSVDRPYSNTKVTLKTGRVCHYHLCWHHLNKSLASEDITEMAIEWLKRIAATVSGEPRIYIDNTIDMIKQDKMVVNDALNADGLPS